MHRAFLLLLLTACSVLAAGFRLYLKDGNYHLVREYKVEGDRVRYYSSERSDWEEIPLALVDLKRTELENSDRQAQQQKEAAELAAEDAAERAERDERERVPVEPGAYLLEGQQLRTMPVAESKVVTNRRRSVLKVLAPIPVVSGKATVELDGERSANRVTGNRPEFYFRLSAEERFVMLRLTPKKGARVVQQWTIVPVTNEIIEEQIEIEVFRKQMADGLYKIWPMKPLEPGEYALVQYTAGKANLQVWDFAFRP